MDKHLPSEMTDIADHARALENTGFWGRVAAGCLFLARDTGRLLIAHRSEYVLEAHTWGTWGGAIDSGESVEDAMKREILEESGYTDEAQLVPLWVFEHSSGFRYHNFLAVVPEEFSPHLNWETQGFQWVEFGNWPDPLHPGLERLLQESSSAIKKAVVEASR